jgi:hypothetical protein
VKFLIGSSLACLIAAIVWSMWGGGSEVDVGSQPRPSHVASRARTSSTRDDFEPGDPPQDDAAAEEPQDTGETEEQELTDGDADLVTVRGRVVPQLGPQPENIRVRLDREDNCTLSYSEAMTGSADCEHESAGTEADPETGDFELQVRPGSYVIVARAEGLLPAGEKGLKLTAGETVEGVLLTLPPGGHVTGFVYGEGEPMNSVKVVVSGEGYVRVAFTDEVGRFDASPLPPGSFSVRAYNASYGGDEKEARTGSSVTLNLGWRLKVRGRVLDARGFPAEGVVISSDYVVTQDEPESDPWPDAPQDFFGGLEAHGCSDDCYTRATTDASGRFELETAPGQVLIVGASRGSERAYVENVTAGRELELTLSGALRTRLVDDDGQPTPGSVQLEPLSHFWDDSLQADADGYLTVPLGSAQTLIVPQGTHLEGALPKGLTVQQREPIDLIY